MILTQDELRGKVAREYLRVSYDRSGNLESPEEQHGENEKDAAALDLVLGEAYAEPEAVSAARWSGKVRGEFERLVADLEGGSFNGRVLILWDSLRGGRSVKDWVRLIDACEMARVLIYVTTHKRIYDPENGRDRRSLQEDAVDAEYDNYKRRTAVVRTTATRAAKGEDHGRVRYGYRRIYDPITRKLVRQEKDPDEAPNVADLFLSLQAGKSLHSIEDRWRAARIMTRGSKAFPPRFFDHSDLLRMARNPAYAGLRVRQPKGTRRVRGSLEGAVDATWPAIVKPEVFHAVQAVLDDPSRRSDHDGRAKHLLTMITLCGDCGGQLTVGYRNYVAGRLRVYRCRDCGAVEISADELDALAEDEMKEFLSREDNAARLRASSASLPELEEVRGKIAETRASLRAWQQKAAGMEVSAESFAAIEPPILAAIARLRERERELSVPPAFAGWTGTRAEVDARWADSPVEVRRKIARRLLSDVYLGVLRVLPAPPGGDVPARFRVRWGDHPAEGYDVTRVRDATRAGLSLEEYEAKLAQGLMYCRSHEQFHPASEFGRNASYPGSAERRCRQSIYEGHARVDPDLYARRAGVTAEVFREKRAAGELFCFRCQAWHPERDFGENKNRPFGKAGSCRTSMRKIPTRSRVQSETAPRPR